MPTSATLPFHSSNASRRTVPAPAAVVCATVGGLLLVASYHHAAGLTTETDQLTFALYWAGYLTGMAALAALACAGSTDPATRVFALVGVALFGTLPKLLRNPLGPLGTDEHVHLRQILETYLRGDVGHQSYQLPVTEFFPGLHQTVSAFAHLTGLPLWTVALSVITLAHVLSVLGIYQLVRAVGAGPAGAATGAVVYTLNPSWVRFDTSVAYESLALPLLIWCLAAAVAACRPATASRGRCTAAAVLAAVAVPVVHHLTAIVMCALLLAVTVWTVACRRRPNGDKVWPSAVVTVFALGSTAYWFAGQSRLITAYLSPSLTRAWTQFGQVLGLTPAPPSTGSGQRTLFAHARIPFYEVASGLLLPVVLFAGVVAAAYVIWPHRRLVPPSAWVFAVLGSLFFVSLPALLTTGGSEGTHRSWAFSFIGIALLCGLARSFTMDPFDPPGVHRRKKPAVVSGPATSPAWWTVAAGLVFVVLTIGGTSASQENVTSRFPGVARAGDDVRSGNPEGRAVSDWIARRTPVDTPVLADRYASFELGASGRMATLSPSAAFPVWDLFIRPEPISPTVLDDVRKARIRYIVVDARMATVRPVLGYWFTVDEPGANGRRPYPASALARFNCLPWLHAVYGTGPLTVYQVDRDLLTATMAGECPGGIR